MRHLMLLLFLTTLTLPVFAKPKDHGARAYGPRPPYRCDGQITLAAAISAQSKLTSLRATKIIGSSCGPVLQSVVTYVSHNWHFKAAVLNGKPVASTLSFNLNFGGGVSPNGF
jgi:hypothetical protein